MFLKTKTIIKVTNDPDRLLNLFLTGKKETQHVANVNLHIYKPHKFHINASILHQFSGA